jgi:hypothetical protein
MGSLAQIRGARSSIEVWPQPLDHLISRKPSAVSKSQQRHQLARPPRRPVPRRNLTLPCNDAETPEKLDTHLTNRRAHSTILANADQPSRP